VKEVVIFVRLVVEIGMVEEKGFLVRGVELITNFIIKF